MKTNKHRWGIRVASDVFGDVSEGNVGEFLKFLPGVDVEDQDAETHGPRLGGLSPEYVGMTMEGAKLTSALTYAGALGAFKPESRASISRHLRPTLCLAIGALIVPA